MIRKILIAEDHEVANLSLQRTLEPFQVSRADYVYYCDHALQRLRAALAEGEPYDLLITDLFFEPDGEPQQITDGESLIRAARELQPRLRVLVFSGEGRPEKVWPLYDELHIDGYVRKARRDADKLREAIGLISQSRTYRPAEWRKPDTPQNAHAFTHLDTVIMELLASGVLQKQIPDHLAERQLPATSLSSVEKRLKLMREGLGFTKNEQLIVYCMENGII